MTREEALQIAAKYCLQEEVEWCINNGYSPWQALAEWDILPDEY